MLLGLPLLHPKLSALPSGGTTTNLSLYPPVSLLPVQSVFTSAQFPQGKDSRTHREINIEINIEDAHLLEMSRYLYTAHMRPPAIWKSSLVYLKYVR